MVTINVENIEALKIWRTLIKGTIPYRLEDVSNLDITLLDFNQKAWEYLKGKRDVREYLDENDDLIVRFRYEYTLKAGTNQVADFNIFVEFFDWDGNVGVSKKLEKELSRKYLTEFNRIVRQNQVDYLMGAGNGFREDAESYPEPIKSQLLAFADLVDAMWVRYEAEILEYVNTGSDVLLNRINNENQEPFLSGLNTIDPETGLTMKQTIINEIT